MSQLLDVILQFLSQFGGGPGLPENNLVRFALPALFWLVLLIVAWTRQRQEHRPREELLVWGFLLAFLREFFMFIHWIVKMAGGGEKGAYSYLIEPLEHILALVAVIVIATAFLRYILDDDRLARVYLLSGLALVVSGFLISYSWFSIQQFLLTGTPFHQTILAIILHAISSSLLAVAMIILIRQQGWLSKTVVLALAFLFLGEFLILINHVTGRTYGSVICPIANSFHIWAVPIFGFVYFREQAQEKKRAEQKVRDYQAHLEDLVDERTAELTAANKQLERAAILEERQRIAAEMHDGLAQTLSSLGLKTDQTANLLQDGQVDQVFDDIKQMQEILNLAVSDVRRSIASLHEKPKPKLSLQKLLAQISEEQDQLQVYLNLQCLEPLFLPADEQEYVLRIVGEALCNVCRHAQAQNATIGFKSESEMYKIEVQDNGRGFDPATAITKEGNHFGLSIMAARAAHIGGQLVVHSKPGQGCRIILTWPMGGSSGNHNDRLNYQEDAMAKAA